MPSHIIIKRTPEGDTFLRDHEIKDKKRYTWVNERSFACRFFIEEKLQGYLSEIRTKLTGSGEVLCEPYE